MDRSNSCGCKGYRTCLHCENTFIVKAKRPNLPNNCKENSYVYCPLCNKAWPGWDMDDYKKHPNHSGEPIEYPGIYIDLNFLSAEEEEQLMKAIDELKWDLSQSGRRKQNFGPKCNFKKRKLKLGEFQGFPESTKFIQDKFKKVPILHDFKTIEQCSLEYDPSNGASIDPHVDDCWIWGERIVTVNCLSDSVLTMTANDQEITRYNLNCVETYPSVLDKQGNFQNQINNAVYEIQRLQFEKTPVIRIPMPKRSLLVIYNSPRYDWEHQILREDIKTRRVCLAYREFTPPYLPPNGKEYEQAKDILEKATNFI